MRIYLIPIIVMCMITLVSCTNKIYDDAENKMDITSSKLIEQLYDDCCKTCIDESIDDCNEVTSDPCKKFFNEYPELSNKCLNSR